MKAKLMHIVDTERLRLRTLALDDAPFYLALVNTAAFIEHIGDRGIRTLEAARAAIADGPMQMQALFGHALCLVERKVDGTPLGTCGLIRRASLPAVDIGYAFLPQFTGQGYASEAAAAMLAYAPAIGITRVLAITSPGNCASQAVLEKIGMRFQRIVHLAPDDSGTWLYARDFLPV